MSNLIGVQIDNRYQVVDLIGEGGMSKVYRAYDVRLDRNIAIKVIDKDRLNSYELKESSQRFKREARILAKLTHPAIVPILDYGEYDGAPYIVMENVAFGTLKREMTQPIAWASAVKLLLPVISGLVYAHSLGIIHRDIKPTNILMRTSSEAVLSDFGIAKLFEDLSSSFSTKTGVIIGTPEYMAPEQGQGMEVDGRADVYGIGTLLYEMVTNHKPYESDSSNPLAVLFDKATKPILDPHKFVPSLPNKLVDILYKALDANPKNRFQTMTDFYSALDDLLFKQIVNTVAEENADLIPLMESVYQKEKKRELELISIWKSFLNKIASLFLRPKRQLTPIESHFKTIQSWKESGTMTVNMIAVLEPQRQKKLLTLINRDHELRIKDILVHYGGGRYLLHGFGRFGASALIDQIVEHARLDLKSLDLAGQQGIVMLVRVELSETDQQNKALGAIVRELRFEAERGKYAKSISKRLEKLQKNNFTRVSESTIENSVSIKATPIPGLETSFSRKSDKTVNPVSEDPSESGVVDVISKFLDRSEIKNQNLLEKLIEKVANSASVPSRVIIVLDRIDTHATFKILQSMRLFSDDRITFFAIVREEEFLQWQTPILQMINKLGFREHYVPCVWEEDHQLVRDMVQISLSSNHHTERGINNFIDYLAYKTRGAPGDVVKELVDPAYNTYEQGVPRLNLKTIRDKKLILFNAWWQRFLVEHWEKILGEYFLTLEEKDRAKIGVYEILDWMSRQVEFRFDDVKNAVSQLRVSLSLSHALQNEVITRLLKLMLERNLLISQDQDIYRVNYDIGIKEDE